MLIHDAIAVRPRGPFRAEQYPSPGSRRTFLREFPAVRKVCLDRICTRRALRGCRLAVQNRHQSSFTRLLDLRDAGSAFLLAHGLISCSLSGSGVQPRAGIECNFEIEREKWPGLFEPTCVRWCEWRSIARESISHSESYESMRSKRDDWRENIDRVDRDRRLVESESREAFSLVVSLPVRKRSCVFREATRGERTPDRPWRQTAHVFAG